jgi:hypothetical protein
MGEVQQVRVSETVKALAEAVVEVHPVRLPLHRLILELLRLMPLYRDVDGLPDWETAIRDATAEREDYSEVGDLLWAVFEFAARALYPPQGYEVFDPAWTEAAFRSLGKALEGSGVKIPEGMSFTGW